MSASSIDSPTRLPKVGCCGWCEGRAKYFEDFTTVELQSTFYEPPSVELAKKWRAAAPASFTFCLKAWQLITHMSSSPTYRKLKSKLSEEEHGTVGAFRDTEQVHLAWERTAAIAKALDASVVLFQCPASFLPEPDSVRDLRRFFSRIHRGSFQLAWEPRGDWPTDLVDGLCRDLDLLLCTDPLGKNARPTLAPYSRLHGRTGYSYHYSDADLNELVCSIRRLDEDGYRCQYIFFNNISMKQDSLRFVERLRATESANW